MAKTQVVLELAHFLMTNKKWWLGTIVMLLILLAALLVLTEGSVLAPFIYALF